MQQFSGKAFAVANYSLRTLINDKPNLLLSYLM